MKEMHIDLNSLMLHQDKHTTFKFLVQNLEKIATLTEIVQVK